jgi:hypothetical protein
VYIAAKKAVQVNSTDDSVNVHGRMGFYVGCAAGVAIDKPDLSTTYEPVDATSVTGYGISGTPTDGISIGVMMNSWKLDKPTPDPKKGIVVDKDHIQIRHGAAIITLQNGQVNIQPDGRCCIG